MAPLTAEQQRAKLIADSVLATQKLKDNMAEFHALGPGAAAPVAASSAAAATVDEPKPGVSLKLWNENPSWANQQANETFSYWINRVTSKNKIPPKGTIVDGIMYGMKSRKSKKSKKSSYRSHKQRYSICKMDPSTLTLVQSRKRRSVCKGAYKKSQRKFSLCDMDKTLLTPVQRKKRRSLCK